MPWQGDLFIGEPVKTREEAEAIYRKLGIELPRPAPWGQGEPEPPDVFDGGGAERFITFKGRELRVYVYGMRDSETCEQAVAFNLTDRYKGSVLDIDCEHGRDDPFVFDPQHLVDILAQVQAWWPGASVFIWDRFH